MSPERQAALMSDSPFFAKLNKPVIGMIHFLPLPGSAAYDGRGTGPVVERALADGRLLAEEGVDAILIQNTGDLPATGDGGPETVAHMSMLGTLLRQAIQTPLGVNILANGAESALAVAHAIGADFVRIKVYVGAVIGIGGVIQGAAQRAQDFLRRIGPARIEIAADVYDRTSRPLVELPIEEAAVQASFHGRAQALVVTGASVDDSLARLRRVKAAVSDKPVYAGGGTTAANVDQFLAVCDGVIVGNAVKSGPAFQGQVDRGRLRAYMDAVRAARR
jgi:membrane complex biogenesis BtpA family protein